MWAVKKWKQQRKYALQIKKKKDKSWLEICKQVKHPYHLLGS